MCATASFATISCTNTLPKLIKSQFNLFFKLQELQEFHISPTSIKFYIQRYSNNHFVSIS